MKSPISRQLLLKMSRVELKALLESINRVLAEKQGEDKLSDAQVALDEADNLFALLKEVKVGEGDIVKAWNGQYQVWQRIRQAVKKMSVERVERLADRIGVEPAALFKLVLDSYPQTDDGYDFSQYRAQVQEDLDNLSIIKKS